MNEYCRCGCKFLKLCPFHLAYICFVFVILFIVVGIMIAKLLL